MITAAQTHTRSRLLRAIAESLDIPESLREKATQRYQAVGEWLDREGGPLKAYRPEIYAQGSFRLGTVTKPITDADDYDIDLVCELQRNKTELTQEKLKADVGKELVAYADAHSMNSRPEGGRRCWTMVYADGVSFHMDILPAIPDDDDFKSGLVRAGIPHECARFAIAITDDEHPDYGAYSNDWPRSNPKGYGSWFQNRMRVRQDDAKRRLVAMEKYAKVEDVPDYAVQTPLQQAVQILKRHRDVMFEHDQDDRPISIIITTLAAHAYDNEADLADALRSIIHGMPQYIVTRKGITWVPNPVNPMENFADKWEQHPQREQKFNTWLDRVRSDINNILDAAEDDRAEDLLQRALGKGITKTASARISEPSPTRSGLVRKASFLPSRFSVPHRQAPRWPMSPQRRVSVSGYVSRNGFRPQRFSSDGSRLPKHCSLRFEAQTDVPRPYKVYWQVVNTGNDAEYANGLRGGFYDGVYERGGLARDEGTRYCGMHWIECFIVKNGVCVARSGEFVVNIE